MENNKLTPKVLKSIANVRYKESQILFDKNQYDGATYLCGYSIEAALKRKICMTLGWDEYPTKGSAYKQTFFTHDLDVLLHLSGIEKIIKNNFNPEWSLILKRWNPELRYSEIGTAIKNETLELLKAIKNILKEIL
ncbi:MAG: hypothetical protein ABSG15_12550 [FCB group bacterium]|jgi:hypothetical protein